MNPTATDIAAKKTAKITANKITITKFLLFDGMSAFPSGDTGCRILGLLTVGTGCGWGGVGIASIHLV